MSASKLIESSIRNPGWWLSQGDTFMADTLALEKQLLTEFPQLADLILGNANGALHINLIRVKPEFQGQGVGGQVLSRLKEFAKKHKVPVTLSPEPDRGKKKALDRFYRGNGFNPNKGRHRDSRYSSMFGPTMIWKSE